MAIFPGESGLASFVEAKDDGSGGNQSHKSYKAPAKSPPPRNQHQHSITFHGLAHPKLAWGLPTLYLTTNSSWLLWGRVAMPLVSPLMPVQHLCNKYTVHNNNNKFIYR